MVEFVDMKRRTLLFGGILPSSLFAGCLSDSQDDNRKYAEPESIITHFDENEPARLECEKESKTLEFDRDTVVEYVGKFDHAYVTHDVLCNRTASNHILKISHRVHERETFDWYDDITVVYLLQAAGASQGVDENGFVWEAELGFSGLVYAVDETGMARSTFSAPVPDTDIEDKAPNPLEEGELVASFE